MQEVFHLYFYNFFHPFKFQRELKARNEHDQKYQLLLVEDYAQSEASIIRPFHFLEILTVTWWLVIVRAFYSLISIHIGLLLFQYWKGDWDLGTMLFNKSWFSDRYLIFSLIAHVVFFPLYMWIYVRFWGFVIQAFSRLFDNVNAEAKAINQVVYSAMTCHSFLLIPVFGDLFQFWATPLYLYAGLKENLQYSRAQALLTVLAPAIAFAFFMVCTSAYLLLVISLIAF